VVSTRMLREHWAIGRATTEVSVDFDLAIA
jgi:hypothetical protein